jgi:FtsP/CotA-like multicopper oxidase with cupredoxin domain/plastocyanin
MPEYWIQLENRPWDASPNNIDRLTGQTIQQRLKRKDAKTTVTLFSPVTNKSRQQDMFLPITGDALILRRYTANWAAPMDRKVNPWDLNEPDPTENGTMGTIPGPVIECSVGESVTVHFKNMDMRGQMGTTQVCFPFPIIGQICFPVPSMVPLATEKRTHSLHPHGFVFAPTSDGAYPLTPPDPSQPIPAGEAAAWSSVGVTGNKQGDRVPPGGTFTYTWNTLGWPTTAGVWLYHDHSICDMENVTLGAIGISVIHNPNDPQDVDIRIPGNLNSDPDPAFLPGGDPNGSPVQTICFPLPGIFQAAVLPHDLIGLGAAAASASAGQATEMPGMSGTPGMTGMTEMTGAPAGLSEASGTSPGMPGVSFRRESAHAAGAAGRPKEGDIGPPIAERLIDRGIVQFELNKDFKEFFRICISTYRTPPSKAQYLQLYHTLGDAGMCVNGRKFMGNTPTLVAHPTLANQPGTKMRFGVVGMGDESNIHTFHIHGHRWVITGPDGTNTGQIMNSPQIRPVSQFEDTRAFGPANSFGFTIDEDGSSFMRAEPAIGEWHMHCHVLNHMMDGMMGSLLVVPGGNLALTLPVGVPCPDDMGMGQPPPAPGVTTITAKNFAWTPNNVTVKSGDTVTFDFEEFPHTVVTTSVTGTAAPININQGGGPTDGVTPVGTKRSVVVTGNPGDQINYWCGIHTASMTGVIHIS